MFQALLLCFPGLPCRLPLASGLPLLSYCWLPLLGCSPLVGALDCFSLGTLLPSFRATFDHLPLLAIRLIQIVSNSLATVWNALPAADLFKHFPGTFRHFKTAGVKACFWRLLLRPKWPHTNLAAASCFTESFE